MGATTGSATTSSRDAPGHCTTRCGRPPRTRGAIHISLVPETGWPHPILGTGDWVAPSNPCKTDPDLAAVVAAWPDLLEAIRAGIVAMVKVGVA